jgi:two-component system sensor histidine kinase TctE
MSDEAGPRRSSLRRRVAWWLLPPLALLLLLNAVWSYKVAMDAANRAYDRSLTASLKSIAENIHATGGRISVDVPYSALDLFEEGVQERVYYAVIGPSGGNLTGYDDLLPPLTTVRTDEPTMFDTQFRRRSIRMGALGKRLYDPELVGGDVVTVLFAETTGARTQLALELFFGSLRRQVLLIIAGAILVMVALTSAFRPLLRLRNTILARHEEDLTPIPQSEIPYELSPLIEAINHHMGRLAEMLQARRRFLADAAHQIRTPLTVLGTQAEYGRRQSDPEDMRRTFASLLASIRGAQRMADQMLTLARAEPANGLIHERVKLNLTELAHSVAVELASLAMKRSIELAFEAPGAPVLVSGNATMLHEMISNLVDNALRYTPQRGQAVLHLAAEGGWARLRISDNGPGIAPAEREKVFQRFYRIPGSGDSAGSGLGLAIVREICWGHGGAVHLGEGANGGGLTVEVRLPLAPA